jgi:hypothetical protein
MKALTLLKLPIHYFIDNVFIPNRFSSGQIKCKGCLHCQNLIMWLLSPVCSLGNCLVSAEQQPNAAVAMATQMQSGSIALVETKTVLRAYLPVLNSRSDFL